MAYIYKITNKINNKVYIGKTEKANPKKRFEEHIYDSKKERCADRPLYRAFNKYGVENFEFEVLENTDNACDREVYYIEKYNAYKSGYNATLGGDGKKYIQYSDSEVIDNYFKTKSMRASAVELCICTDTIKNILDRNSIVLLDKNVLQRKPVLKLDKITLEVIEEYPSLAEAARQMGNVKYDSNISRVCRGERKTALGFKWKYKYED